MLKLLFIWILKIRSKAQSSKGFTLMELLIAASMTIIVVGVAGWALVQVVKTNKIAKATSDVQYDYNRAVEFITEELKGAKKIYHGDDLQEDLLMIAPNFIQEDWKIPVLAFQAHESVGEHVVYYLVDPKKSSNTKWAGPLVLYRYGPPYSDGKYSVDKDDKDGDGDTTEVLPPRASDGTRLWSGFALVDMVSTLALTEEDRNKRECRNPFVEGDGEEWKRYPSADEDDQINGFFICVPTKGDLKGEQVEIHLYGQIEATEGKNAYLQNHLTYGVVTQTFLRGGETSLIQNGEPVATLFNCTPGSVSCSILTPKKDITLTLEYIPNDQYDNEEGGTGQCDIKLLRDDLGVGAVGLSAGKTYLSESDIINVGQDIGFSFQGGVCTNRGVVIYSDTQSAYIQGTDGTELKNITEEDSNTSPNAQKLSDLLGRHVEGGRLKLAPNQFVGFFDPTASMNGKGSPPYNPTAAILVITVNLAE